MLLLLRSITSFCQCDWGSAFREALQFLCYYTDLLFFLFAKWPSQRQVLRQGHLVLVQRALPVPSPNEEPSRSKPNRAAFSPRRKNWPPKFVASNTAPGWITDLWTPDHLHSGPCWIPVCSSGNTRSVGTLQAVIEAERTPSLHRECTLPQSTIALRAVRCGKPTEYSLSTGEAGQQAWPESEQGIAPHSQNWPSLSSQRCRRGLSRSWLHVHPWSLRQRSRS